MPAVKIRRIDSSDPKSGKHLESYQKLLASRGDIVSAKTREMSRKVFREALTPVEFVERICADIRDKGLTSVLRFTEQFDRVKLTPETVRVSPDELRSAHAAADPDFLDTVRNLRQNILSFQMGVLNADAVLTVSGSYELQLRYRPLKRVGVCVPGGATSAPSTLLMTVVPAQAAEVQEIAVLIPPAAPGADNPDLLAVCHELGITEVYRLGGAQGVAALAYGADGIPPVDMIVGPGNVFVTLAKRFVYGQVAIDCLAGSGELVVLGDASARPEFVAADMIAQAEHSPGVSVLITWHAELIAAVADALTRQLSKRGRDDPTRDNLQRFGALIRVENDAAAVALVNQLAPEHLHVQTRDPEAIAERVEHVGAIFMGHFTPVALGDYGAGPSHVLPTGQTARFTSGLNSNDFLRRTSLVSFTHRGMKLLAEDVQRFAQKEGLTGHAASVAIRMGDPHPVVRHVKKPEKSDKIVRARR